MLYKIYFAKKNGRVGERGSQEKSYYKNNYFEIKNI